MAEVKGFIRCKPLHSGRPAYYLVRNVRIGGKVSQKVLAYLGPCDTVQAAAEHYQQDATYYAGQSAKAAARAETCRAKARAWADRAEQDAIGKPWRPWTASCGEWVDGNPPKPERRPARGQGYKGQCFDFWRWLDYAKRYTRKAERAAEKAAALRGLLPDY